MFLYKHAPSEIITGDLNLDGLVNNEDVGLCVEIILGRESNPTIANRADVDGDGRITVLDLQLLINAVFSK